MRVAKIFEAGISDVGVKGRGVLLSSIALVGALAGDLEQRLSRGERGGRGGGRRLG